MVVLNCNDKKETRMENICDSEKKRRKSLKIKKEIFKARESAVQDALRNLDNRKNKNKVTFDDDFYNTEASKQESNRKGSKRKRDLFDNDSDNDSKNDSDLVWDESKFEIKKNVVEQLLKQNITLGNDERFKMDERFIEDDQKPEQNVITENTDNGGLENEKKLQLNILENILGTSITSKKSNGDKELKVSKKVMIRYDPTEKEHKGYEINVENAQTITTKTKKTKKMKDNVENITNSQPAEVSKDVYFSVSDSLSKSLKEEKEFSLLKTYGKVENSDEVVNNNMMPNTEPLHPAKVQFNYMSSNPFKYDSSDDEPDNTEQNNNTEQHQDYVVADTNKFFFDINDVRFNEAQKFFSSQQTSGNSFKDIRRELKQIVYSKVHRNIKKKQPWGYKKKVKRS